MTLKLQTPEEMARTIAERARDQRLAMNLTRAGLAARAGMSVSSLKRFEHTGEIAFVSLLRIANALGAVDDFENLFSRAKLEFRTIDEVIESNRKRQRGRRS